MRKIALGFSIYFSGMRTWATHASLLRLSIIPFLIDLVCLAGGIYFTILKIPEIVAHIIHKPELWYQFILYYFILILTSLSLFFIVIFIVFIFANLLAFPFNDLLAEKTLALNSALPEKKGGIKGWASKSVKNMNAMFKKTLIMLAVGGIMAVAALIPGVGIIGAIIGVFLMAVDRLDYAFDHYQWTFKQRMAFVRAHFYEMVGFAGALGLTTAIPVINMLVMPGSVVAGAALVAKMKKEEIKIP